MNIITLLFFILTSSTLTAQITWDNSKPDYPEEVWEIKQFRRVKDHVKRRKAAGHKNMDWARWQAWEALQTQKSQPGGLGNWQNLGPDTGSGRIISITFHPSDSNTFYVGSASGGLWETNDYGQSWAPMTDAYPTMGVGAVAFNPKDPSSMLIATGEGYIYSSEITYGTGIYHSTDTGQTWQTTNAMASLAQSFAGQDICWSHSDTNKVCIATTWGVLYSNDGGRNYTTSLAALPSRMKADPKHPDTLYCAARYYNSTYGGGFYRSYDAGATWTAIGAGLPNSQQMGYSSLSIHPIHNNIIYLNVSQSALLGIGPSLGIYKSTDYGNTFTLVPSNVDVLCNPHPLYSYCQGWYDNTLHISTTDTNTLYAGGVFLWKSQDGGTNWGRIDTFPNGSRSVHADHHQTTQHPITGDLFDCHDGGVSYSKNGGANWVNISNGLITYQYYSIAVSEQAPDLIIGGTQDMGLLYSNNAHSPGTWSYANLGDVFSTIIDHSDPNIWYATIFPLYGQVKTYNAGANWYATITGLVDNPQWRAPMIMHPTQALTLLTASDSSIYKTHNGSIWQQKANIGSLSAMAYDPINPSLVYGSSLFTNDLYYSVDSGETWATLGNNPGGPITDLTCHPNISGILYATVGSFGLQDQVYVSIDFGLTWLNVSNNLPAAPANCMAINPIDPSHLYIGTDLGVWHSDDNGSTWQAFNNGLPYIVVEDIHYLQADSSIRIGTYGRGYWRSPAIPASPITGPKAIASVEQAIQIYPNPTTGFLFLNNSLKESIESIRIFNLQGQLIQSFPISLDQIDLSNLPRGLYTIEIRTKTQQQISRIQKL